MPNLLWQVVRSVQETFRRQSLLLLGVSAVAGFYFGVLARRLRLPSVIGFMLLGAVLGPSVLELFYEGGEEGVGNLQALAFITEVALGFVAFTIGTELRLRSLRALGGGIVSIILAESFMAFVVVMGAVYVLTGSWPMALLFGAVAPASAPAGTVAVIQEYRAAGSLTQALYAVVGFDDGLAIMIFGFAAALATDMPVGASTALLGSVVLGGVLLINRFSKKEQK